MADDAYLARGRGMAIYVGDRGCRVLHSAELKPRCIPDIDVRDVLDVHSEDMGQYLLRSERWTACPRCLAGMQAI